MSANIILLILAGVLAQQSFPAQLKIETANSKKLGLDNQSSQASKAGEPGSATIYQVSPKPFAPIEFAAYLKRFSIPDDAPMKTIGKVKIINNKRSVMTYDEVKSETFFSSEDAPDLDKEDFVPDDEIQIKMDEILAAILKDEAKNYSFINFEKNMVKKSEFEDPEPIAYYANYARIIDGRPVISGEFLVRICYGGGGAVKEFTIRNPILKRVKSISLNSTSDLRAKLISHAENQSEIKSPTGSIPVLTCTPLTRVSSYMSVSHGVEKLLIPHISFLTENALDPFIVHSTQPQGTPITFTGRINIPEAD